MGKFLRQQWQGAERGLCKVQQCPVDSEPSLFHRHPWLATCEGGRLEMVISW